MNSDALYKNIGFVAVVVLFLYIVNKVVKLQNKTIEGLSMGSSSSRSKSSSRDDEEEEVGQLALEWSRLNNSKGEDGCC